MLDELAAEIARAPGGHRLPGLCGHVRTDQLQRPGAPVLPAQRPRGRRHPGQPRRQASPRQEEPRDRAGGAAGARGDRSQARRLGEGRRGAAGSARAGAARRGGLRPVPGARSRSSRATCARSSMRRPDIVDVDDSIEAPSPRLVAVIDRQKAALLGVSQAEAAQTLAAGLGGLDATYVQVGPRDLSDSGAAGTRRARQGRPRQRAGAAGAIRHRRAACRSSEIVTVEQRAVGQRDLPQGPAAAVVGDRRCRGRDRQPALRHVRAGRHARRRRCRPARPAAVVLQPARRPRTGRA